MVHDGYYGCYVPVGDASFDVATMGIEHGNFQEALRWSLDTRQRQPGPRPSLRFQRNPDHWMTGRSAGARHGPRASETEAGRLEPAPAMSLHVLHPG